MWNKDFKLNTWNKAYYEALDEYKTTSEEFSETQSKLYDLTTQKNDLTQKKQWFN